MQGFPGALPPRAVLFDIDNTLYRNDAFVTAQVQGLKEQLAHVRRESLEETEKVIAATGSAMRHRDGAHASLGNIFLELGIPLATSVAWRRAVVHPGEFLKEDPGLRDVLEELSRHYRLGALTNNPADIGGTILQALGISGFFPSVVGLDTTLHSKPHWPPFAAALERLETPVERVLMVGDRYDVDLKPVVDRGGSGFLVESREDLDALLPWIRDTFP